MKLTGIISAIVTPFSQDGERINEDELRGLVESGIRAGLGGIVSCGGTGEFTTLSTEERRRVLEVIIEQVHGRVAVMAQVGGTSTREACSHATHAEATGADAIMLATPYYEPMSFDAVRRYYREVASATRLPICIYNHPGAMKLRFNPEMVATLIQENQTVAFIKDSSGDLGLPNAINAGEIPIELFAGDDMLVLPSLVLGCAGIIYGSANFIAPALVKMWGAARAGHLSELQGLWSRVSPLLNSVCSGHYNSGVKAACTALGFSVGPIRAPYGGLQEKRDEEIGRLVRQMDPSLLNTRLG